MPLPKGYEWCTPDITIDEEVSRLLQERSKTAQIAETILCVTVSQCKEVQTLLSENYVEDDDASFRLHYSKEFLHWSVVERATLGLKSVVTVLIV